MNVQAIKVEGGEVKGNSKVAKVSPATLKYAAPKLIGKATPGAGSVTVNWNASQTSGNRTYELGIWDAKSKTYLFAGDVGYAALVTNAGITIPHPGTATTATITGLAAQKYTLGLREVLTEGTVITKSAIAKISVSPLKYKAPKLAKGAKAEGSSGSFEVVKSVDNPGTAEYIVGVWDKSAKAWMFGSDRPLGFSASYDATENKIAYGGGVKGMELGIFEKKADGSISSALKVKVR